MRARVEGRDAERRQPPRDGRSLSGRVAAGRSPSQPNEPHQVMKRTDPCRRHGRLHQGSFGGQPGGVAIKAPHARRRRRPEVVGATKASSWHDRAVHLQPVCPHRVSPAAPRGETPGPSAHRDGGRPNAGHPLHGLRHQGVEPGGPVARPSGLPVLWVHVGAELVTRTEEAPKLVVNAAMPTPPKGIGEPGDGRIEPSTHLRDAGRGLNPTAVRIPPSRRKLVIDRDGEPTHGSALTAWANSPPRRTPTLDGWKAATARDALGDGASAVWSSASASSSTPTSTGSTLP